MRNVACEVQAEDADATWEDGLPMMTVEVQASVVVEDHDTRAHDPAREERAHTDLGCPLDLLSNPARLLDPS
jgi:hypothetical protein